eukprot:2446195-Rhodomonas_salina.1
MEADGLAYAATVLGALQGEPHHAGVGAAEERWLVDWDDSDPDGPVVTTGCILLLITAAELEHRCGARSYQPSTSWGLCSTASRTST